MNLGLISLLGMCKVAGVAEEANAMLPEYERQVANPYGALGLGGALGLMGGAAGLALSRIGHGIGMEAGSRLANMLPGKWGMAAALLASSALPAMAGLLQEYVTRDDRAREMLRRDLSDIQSDILTGLDIARLTPEQKMLLLNRAAEIQRYLSGSDVSEDQSGLGK